MCLCKLGTLTRGICPHFWPFTSVCGFEQFHVAQADICLDTVWKRYSQERCEYILLLGDLLAEQDGHLETLVVDGWLARVTHQPRHDESSCRRTSNFLWPIFWAPVPAGRRASPCGREAKDKNNLRREEEGMEGPIWTMHATLSSLIFLIIAFRWSSRGT